MTGASLSVWRLTRRGAETIQVTSSHRGLVGMVGLPDAEALVTGCPWRTTDDMLAWCEVNGFEATVVEQAKSTAWRDGSDG